MSISIDQAFINQYSAEVKEAYQRMGSLLRGTCRTEPIRDGANMYFPTVGKGSASTKARHAVVAPMNQVHAQVSVTLADYYAGDWVDKFDLLKTNIGERQIVANGGAYALGRKSDDLILAALNKGSADIAHGSAGLTMAKVQSIIQKAGEADIPDDGQRFAVIAPKAWADLLGLDKFTSRDYVGDDPVLKAAGPTRVRQWMGITWIMHSAIKVSGSTYTNFFWHRSAAGHVIAADVQTEVTYHGDRVSWFVNSMMSQAAVKIDSTGILQFETQ